MAESPTSPAALALYLTDRSRYETGLDHCERDRYLGYHAGPHGYGWQRKAQSVPAVTGQLIHSPITAILEQMRVHDAIPPDAVIATHIREAQAEYQKIVETRGLMMTLDAGELERRVQEQLTLLEGLVWTWVRVALPAFHAEHRVVLVEQEYVTVYGCTCGLGDGVLTGAEHDARECAGIGWMTRADAVTERRGLATHAYHEFKTTGDASMNWESQWQYRTQLVGGIVGAEQALGVRIDEVYIHALIKGRFQSEWNPDEGKASGPKYQNSPLVYGWRRPANPPLSSETWAASYNYVDELGKRRRLGKEYVRTGLWELPSAVWQDGGCQSASDYWTRWIEPLGLLSQQYRQIGPIYRKDWQLAQFVRQLVATEERWETILWTLSDSGLEWDSEGFQDLLDKLVPMTRGSSCHSYFGDSCPFIALCDRHEGWQDPALMGYIPRRPHHVPELNQALARGLLPPDEGLGGEVEE